MPKQKSIFPIKDKKITIKVTDAEREWFRAEASKLNLSVSKYIFSKTIDSK